MLMLVLEKVAVQSWLQREAIAVREWERSASLKTWASMVGPAAAMRNRVDATDLIWAPLGNSTTSCLEASKGRLAGMSDALINVSVAPVSASVWIVCRGCGC